MNGELIVVELQKGPNGLGLSLAGNKDRTKMSVFVCGVHPSGNAAKDGRIKIGDELLEVCDENRLVIHKDIVVKVQNLEIKRGAEDLLTCLKIIAVALDKMQRNDCTISEGIELWFGVQSDLQQLGTTGVTQPAKDRFDMAITDYHFLANLLDPRYQGAKLTDSMKDAALTLCHAHYPDAMPSVLKYLAKTSPFLQHMFAESVLTNITPLTWWQSLRDRIDEPVLKLVTQLNTAVASSAGIERIFSTYRLVHTKLKNRLEQEKAAKLVSFQVPKQTLLSIVHF
ncbi:uncharacterized protein LOC111634730 isoform X3 [Centruroides sculpturatus]|nr:uncharacterized protein LOC111634730 isoform X3 [Centruroides sculpturatus]XP_023235338.1 uncharacterized protein LOC111634730 isoform X3 [Centruroides sculpturatus]XP_023235339.1 uncharacterized protein LOC111634730 isoform X3 [Centruroides sculpturatus]XP_023235340.1 uncharacterized protein LOC111634730 isoform X3 [Centruroides sculpturatus]